MKTLADYMSPRHFRRIRPRWGHQTPSKWKVHKRRRSDQSTIDMARIEKNQIAGLPFILSLFIVLLPINFKPFDDPGKTPDLVIWLDANDLDGDGISEGLTEVGHTSGQVTAWTDKISTSNYTNTAGLSAGTSPDLIIDGINFNESIEFNNSVSSDYLARQITNFPSQNITVAMVIKSSGSGDGIISYATSSNDNELLLLDQSNLELHVSNVSPGSTGVAVNQGDPKIVMMEFDDDQDLYLYVNGAAYSGNPDNIGSPLGSTGTLLFGQDQDIEGGIFSASQAFEGHIGEVLIYDRILPDKPIERLQSYLALKFGITLDQTSGIDYKASTNTVIWDFSENTTYRYDIAGIGRDDDSELHQEKSRSQNFDGIVTLGIHTSASLNDGEYLVWSNNDSPTGTTATIVSGGLELQKMSRQWRVQEKNFNDAGSGIGTVTEMGTVDVSFDLEGISYVADEVKLIVDGDGDFSNGATILSANGTFDGDEVTFANVDLDDGQFFSIALTTKEGPGGISANLNYWLDAQDLDADGNVEGIAGEGGQTAGQVTTWANKAGAVDFNIHAGFASGTAPDLKESQVNFNAAVEFNESTASDYLGAQVTDFPTSEITQFLVLKSTGSGDGMFSYATVSFDNEFLVFNQNNIHIWARNSGGPSTSINLSSGAPEILSVDRTATNGHTNSYHNGQAYSGNPQQISSGNSLNSTGTIILAQEQDALGGGFQSAQAFEGQLSEVITYASVLSSTERQQVNSYLALKYGITLDQTSGTDYLASNGIVVWDYSENPFYIYDIAGIARDDLSTLEQNTSKSEHGDDILTISKNSGTTPSDGQFLIWANDNGSASSTEFADVNGTRYLKTVRQWRIQEKNFVDSGSGIGTDSEYGTVDISFDLTGLSYTASSVRLLFDTDGGFNSGTSVSNVIGSFDGDVVTFSNVDIDDGQYLSIALDIEEGPGGVGVDLELWIRSDLGITGSQSVEWADQSSNNVILTKAGAPSLVSDTLNFNPAVRFNGDSSFFTTNLDINATTHPDLTVHSVYRPRIEFAGGVWGEDDLNWDRFMMDFGAFPHFNNVVSNGVSATFNIPSIFDVGFTNATSVIFDEDLLNGSYVHASGKRVQTFTSHHGPQSSAPMQIGAIGDGDTFGYAFDGDIGEVIVYSTVPTVQEHTRVQTYLSLKYGLTLSSDYDGNTITGESHGSFTEGDYLASNGIVIWDYSENVNYHHDVAGIGKDDLSVLYQPKSKSQNSGAILKVDREVQGIINNGDFLIWGNNDQSTTVNDTINLFGISLAKMQRQWRFQEKSFSDGGAGIGTVSELGNVDLTFDLEGLDYSSGMVRLLLDDDGDFSSGATFIPATTSFDGDLVTFEDVDIDDGQIIGVALKFIPLQDSPVNINNNSLVYHFDANDLDADGTSEGANESGVAINGSYNEVNTWVNKVGGGNNLDVNAGLSPGTTPDLKLDQINFNDVIELNEFVTSDYLGAQVSNFPSTEITLFSVFKSAGSNDPIFSYATSSHDNELLIDEQQNLFISAANVASNPGVVVNDGNPTILTTDRTSSSGATNLFLNAGAFGGNPISLAVGANLISTGTIIIGQEQDAVGGGFDPNQAFQGQMAELLVYNSVLTSTERLQVESYLAIKYGITLDQTTGTDYLASNDIVIWDYSEATSYVNDIAGIGSDAASNLHQPKSKSSNSDAILTIEALERQILGDIDINQPISDGHFLVWGNDNASINNTSAILINESGIDVVYNKMDRQWRIQEKSFADGGSGIGTPEDIGSIWIELSFDLTGLSYVANEVRLLISNDNFTTAVTSEIFPTFDGDVATFQDVDLSDGDYISLALSLKDSPGAVSDNLVLWLKANEGTTVAAGVSDWTDQSGNSNDATQASTGSQASLNTSAINFNPALDFDGTDDHLDLPDGILSAGDDAVAIYSVWQTDIDNAHQRVISFGEVVPGQAISQQTGINGGFGGKNFGLQSEVSPYNQGYLVPYETGTIYIGTTFTQNTATNDIEVAFNGASFSQATASNSARNLTSTNNHISERFQSSGAEYFNGRIAELVVYSDPQNATDRQRVESYLAIKYGITLDQTSGTDYLASDGTTEIWDKDASGASTHNHDIAGIGRDDYSGLVQKQSRSVNSGSIVTMGRGGIAVDNASNTNQFTTDRVFLVWGNDDDLTDQANANTSDLPGNSSERMERVWRVDATGSVGTVSVSFDLTGLGYGSEISDFKLIIAGSSSNGVMADGTTISASSIASNTVTFDHVTFTDGQYFTIATKAIATPGGVFTNLELWLKANLDVYSDSGITLASDGSNVQQWNDKSGNSNSSASVISGRQPVFRSSAVNFNPAIDFDGNNDRLAGDAGGNMDDVFMVVVPHDVVDENLNSQPVYVTDHVLEDNTGLYFGGSTVAFSNEVITVFGGSNGIEDWRRAQTGSESHPANVPFILSFTNEDVTQSTLIYKNAERIDNASANNWRSLPNNEEYIIGFGDNPTGAGFDGEIAEVINYSGINLLADRRRIESYLAIKYGITLRPWQNEIFITSYDYLDSDENAIWQRPVNGVFDNDIAGIGMDLASGLDQKQSKSINSDAIVTIGLDDELSPDGLESSNAQNDGAFSENLSFLMWANDGAEINPTVPNEEIDRTLTNSRLNREWQVQETGSIGTVTIQFDVSGIAGPTGVGTNDESQIQLMIDDDGDFTSGASIVFQSFEIPGDGLVNFRHDFSDGEYFTLASSELNALPIELISLEARLTEEGVMLEWTTGSETGNSSFTIERASSELNFQTIGSINGSGNTSGQIGYNFLDDKPIPGTNYYRLIDTDIGGVQNISQVIRVDFKPALEGPTLEVNIYPNPVNQGDPLNIELTRSFEQLNYRLYDSKGKLEVSGMARHYSRSDPLILNTNYLASGVYLLNLSTSDGDNLHSKIIVKD